LEEEEEEEEEEEDNDRNLSVATSDVRNNTNGDDCKCPSLRVVCRSTKTARKITSATFRAENTVVIVDAFDDDVNDGVSFHRVIPLSAFVMINVCSLLRPLREEYIPVFSKEIIIR